MKPCSRTVVMCGLAAAILSRKNFATISVDSSIISLVTASSAIVIGTITTGSVVGGTVSLTIQVEDSLKGGVAMGSMLIIAPWREGQALPDRAIRKGRGLFFLRSDPSGLLVINAACRGACKAEDAYYFVPEGSRPPEYRVASNAAVSDRVFQYLAWGVDTGMSSRFAGSTANITEAFQKEWATPFVRATFRRWTQSLKPNLKMAGIRGGLRAGELDALAVVESQRTALRALPSSRGVEDDIAAGFDPADPRVTSTLVRLLAAQDDLGLQRAAAGMLATARNRSNLRHLAPLLDSPDPTLRTYAIGALSIYANNIDWKTKHPAPGEWKYRTDETMAHSVMSPEIVVRDPKYVAFLRIPMMPISQSDLMPISSERSDAGLPQCELLIGIRQGFLRVGLFFIELARGVREGGRVWSIFLGSG